MTKTSSANQLPVFPTNMDKLVDDMLRNQIKEFLKFKAQMNPNMIIKENFIFDVVKKAINLYHTELIKRNRNLRYDDLLSFNSDIIAAIIERHIFYSFKATEVERLRLQNDNDYKIKLERETVDDLIVNKYVGKVSQNMTTAYFPPVSKIMVINNLLYELFMGIGADRYKDSKHIAVSHVFSRIIEQVKACCLLLDKFLFADAIVIWRGLFESELVLTILSYWNEEVSKEYLEFVEYQMLENNIVYEGKNKEDVEKKLEEKATLRKTKKSRNFINYGWLMKTQEYHDNGCQLNIKEGLAVVANKYVKYTDYQLASNISHSPYFSKRMKEEQLMRYVVELIVYSLETIVSAMFNYMEEENKNVNENIKNRIDDSFKSMHEMFKIMEKNNS